MKTTQILSVMLTLIFIVVRFALLAGAVIAVRSPRRGPQRVGARRDPFSRTHQPKAESSALIATP